MEVTFGSNSLINFIMCKDQLVKSHFQKSKEDNEVFV